MMGTSSSGVPERMLGHILHLDTQIQEEVHANPVFIDVVVTP